MQDLISVIVPVYNVLPFLEQCVSSILAQTYASFELLLIDDGSTDGSGALCDTLALRDKRIRVTHKRNTGVSDTRNVGLDQVRGKYVFFVDSDDYLHPQSLEILLDLLERENADIAIGFQRGTHLRDYAEPDQDTYTIRRCSGRQALEMIITGDKKCCFDYFGYTPTSTCGRLFRKELFDGVRYDPESRGGEDDEVSLLLYDKADKIVTIDRRLYYWYIRQGSLGRGRSEERSLYFACGITNTYLRCAALFREKDSSYRDLAYRNYRSGLLVIADKRVKEDYPAVRKLLRKRYGKLYRMALQDKALPVLERFAFAAAYFLPSLPAKLHRE